MTSLPVRPLSPAEQALVKKINDTWTREKALSELKNNLQIAIEVELATLPIYLFTYYSINRLPDGFPDQDLARFADQAGGVIMSVAVEEMLHMSLSSNILFSLGQKPQLYLNSPSPFPTDLPGHAKLGPDHKPLALPLAKFSCDQLWQFLEIEYPAEADAPPEEVNWQTIGQIYSYIRCIISSKFIFDEDFQTGSNQSQIQPGNYSPNNIDTIYPSASFNYSCPVPAPAASSAATVASFPSDSDSHAGSHQLITITSKLEAMQAIETIDAQGEGFAPGKLGNPENVDDLSKMEESHYYKFLTLQSYLKGYDPNHPWLPKYPKPPQPASVQFSQADLDRIVYPFPQNPVAAAYPPGPQLLANVVSGLYQYMLIMTESIFLEQQQNQKLYFNQALHRSMIWILDKILRSMRDVNLSNAEVTSVDLALAPTFENVNLGTRDQAFATLCSMCQALDTQYGNESWYSDDLKYYVDLIPTLPDVSALWKPAGTETASALVAAKKTPVSKPRKKASRAAACPTDQYKGVPKFPQNPPKDINEGEVRHACMGLNSCKSQGRTRDNACAGQGYCSTALEYNYGDPSSPLVSDHTCHVKNNCAGQGGCGLYGTGEEQSNPGANSCAALGSCATPINAERFSSDGDNQGKSVWLRARQVFTEKTWPELRAANPNLPPAPPLPAAPTQPNPFQYGPTIEWIENYSDQGMTACGSSGMSGANSCA